MPAPLPVAILGFSAFDRKALASYFQFKAQLRSRFERVLSIEDADLVIADADEAGVLDLLQTLGRIGDALFIGAQAPAGAVAWLMRPIDPTQVLRALEALATRRDDPDSAPLPLPLPAGLGRGALGMIGSASLPGPPSRRTGERADPSGSPAPSPHERDEQRRRLRAALSQPQINPRALLVDDSEVALHFLRRQLEGYGLAIDLARHSDRALDLLTHHAYGIVFLDVDLGEHSRSDGLTLCHQIRHRLLHPGGRMPMVVMVSAFHDPVHQVRGTLAGADAYLGKPLDLAALNRLLQRQGLVRQPAPPPGAQPLPQRPA